jgi:hypothetical protein
MANNSDVKISKEALENLAFPLLLLFMANFIFLTGGGELFDAAIVLVLDVFAFYFITENGYSVLKKTIKLGFKALFFWLIPIAIISWLIIMFVGLPPTSIIIFLLLAILFK